MAPGSGRAGRATAAPATKPVRLIGSIAARPREGRAIPLHEFLQTRWTRWARRAAVGAYCHTPLRRRLRPIALTWVIGFALAACGGEPTREDSTGDTVGTQVTQAPDAAAAQAPARRGGNGRGPRVRPPGPDRDDDGDGDHEDRAEREDTDDDEGEDGDTDHDDRVPRSTAALETLATDRAAVSPNGDGAGDVVAIDVTAAITLKDNRRRGPKRPVLWSGVELANTEARAARLALAELAGRGSPQRTRGPRHRVALTHVENIALSPAFLPDGTFAVAGGLLLAEAQVIQGEDLTAYLKPLVDALLDFGALPRRGADDKLGQIQLTRTFGEDDDDDEEESDEDAAPGVHLKIKLADKQTEQTFKTFAADAIAAVRTRVLAEVGARSKLKLTLHDQVPYDVRAQVILDRVPPAAMIVAPPSLTPPLATSAPTLDVQAEITDDRAGLADVGATFGGVEVIEQLARAGDTLGGTLVFPREGPISFAVHAEDAAGNRAADAVTVIADFTAPAIFALTPAAGLATNDTSTQLVADGRDATSGIDFSASTLLVDGTGQAIGALPTAFTPAGGWTEGRHDWQVVLVDRAGNAAVSALRDLLVDVTPPVFEKLVPADGFVSPTSTVAIEVAFDDSLAGIVADETRLTVDGEVVVNSSASSVSFVAPGGWAEGEHTWSVGVVDRAGNGATVAERTFRVITNQPPVAEDLVLTAPASQPITARVMVFDPDGDPLTIELVDPPAVGVANFGRDEAGDFGFFYQPQQGFLGTATFTYKVNDGKADSNLATVTLSLIVPEFSEPAITFDPTFQLPPLGDQFNGTNVSSDWQVIAEGVRVEAGHLVLDSGLVPTGDPARFTGILSTRSVSLDQPFRVTTSVAFGRKTTGAFATVVSLVDPAKLNSGMNPFEIVQLIGSGFVGSGDDARIIFAVGGDGPGFNPDSEFPIIMALEELPPPDTFVDLEMAYDPQTQVFELRVPAVGFAETITGVPLSGMRRLGLIGIGANTDRPIPFDSRLVTKIDYVETTLDLEPGAYRTNFSPFVDGNMLFDGGISTAPAMLFLGPSGAPIEVAEDDTPLPLMGLENVSVALVALASGAKVTLLTTFGRDALAGGLAPGDQIVAFFEDFFIGRGRPRDFHINAGAPPQTVLTAAPATTTEDREAIFEFTSNDAQATFECRIDISNWMPCASPVSITDVALGRHFFAVRAINAAGDIDPTAAESFWEVIDITPPETTLISSPSVLTENAVATFEFESNESPVSFVCSLDGRTPEPCASPLTKDVGLGRHRFEIAAVDEAGNVDPSPVVVLWDVALDIEPPETLIRFGPPLATPATTAIFEFAASEFATFSCRVDTAPFGPCDPVTAVTGLDEGMHTMEVVATDSQGNVDPSPARQTWEVDFTPPVAAFVSTPSDPSNSSTAEFVLAADGTTEFLCSLDGAPFERCLEQVRFEGLAETTHTFVVKATDPAGNVQADPTTFTWTIQQSVPQTRLLGGPATRMVFAEATFVFGANQAGSVFECAFDGGSFQACDSPYTVGNLGEGEHQFQVRAINAFGRVDPSPVAVTWTVDLPVEPWRQWRIWPLTKPDAKALLGFGKPLTESNRNPFNSIAVTASYIALDDLPDSLDVSTGSAQGVIVYHFAATRQAFPPGRDLFMAVTAPEGRGLGVAGADFRVAIGNGFVTQTTYSYFVPVSLNTVLDTEVSVSLSETDASKRSDVSEAHGINFALLGGKMTGLTTDAYMDLVHDRLFATAQTDPANRGKYKWRTINFGRAPTVRTLMDIPSDEIIERINHAVTAPPFSRSVVTAAIERLRGEFSLPDSFDDAVVVGSDPMPLPSAFNNQAPAFQGASDNLQMAVGAASIGSNFFYVFTQFVVDIFGVSLGSVVRNEQVEFIQDQDKYFARLFGANYIVEASEVGGTERHVCLGQTTKAGGVACSFTSDASEFDVTITVTPSSPWVRKLAINNSSNPQVIQVSGRCEPATGLFTVQELLCDALAVDVVAESDQNMLADEAWYIFQTHNHIANFVEEILDDTQELRTQRPAELKFFNQDNISSYGPNKNKVKIRESAQNVRSRRPIVMHEVSHWLNDELFDELEPPGIGIAHPFCTDRNTLANRQNAFIEAFARFGERFFNNTDAVFTRAVPNGRRSASFTLKEDSLGVQLGIQNTGSCDTSIKLQALNEMAIGAVLWDLADGPNERYFQVFDPVEITNERNGGEEPTDYCDDVGADKVTLGAKQLFEIYRTKMGTAAALKDTLLQRFSDSCMQADILETFQFNFVDFSADRRAAVDRCRPPAGAPSGGGPGSGGGAPATGCSAMPQDGRWQDILSLWWIVVLVGWYRAARNGRERCGCAAGSIRQARTASSREVPR